MPVRRRLRCHKRSVDSRLQSEIPTSHIPKCFKQESCGHPKRSSFLPFLESTVCAQIHDVCDSTEDTEISFPRYPIQICSSCLELGEFWVCFCLEFSVFGLVSFWYVDKCLKCS
ncbi:hypothetical protein DV515_00013443 [Chloebia gouldiae]|uniref:Uncharacterized protein n=1 Tax=Chloebia gouldiae TaxID=44316 RepID=A0A3L8S2B7_CHLGU|nr:hypothetical protein DV515_00013443 [Chloebia gouldiae]